MHCPRPGPDWADRRGSPARDRFALFAEMPPPSPRGPIPLGFPGRTHVAAMGRAPDSSIRRIRRNQPVDSRCSPPGRRGPISANTDPISGRPDGQGWSESEELPRTRVSSRNPGLDLNIANSADRFRTSGGRPTTWVATERAEDRRGRPPGRPGPAPPSDGIRGRSQLLAAGARGPSTPASISAASPWGPRLRAGANCLSIVDWTKKRPGGH